MNNGNETLCFTCAKACTKKCSWSSEFIPVNGWTALSTRNGYFVSHCPEYVCDTIEDGEHKGERKEEHKLSDIDNSGAMKLLEALAYQMRDDYVKGHGPYSGYKIKGLPSRNRPCVDMRFSSVAEIRAANRKLIEKFIVSESGKKMLQFENPEEVIRQLRVLARHYENEMMQFMKGIRV